MQIAEQRYMKKTKPRHIVNCPKPVIKRKILKAVRKKSPITYREINKRQTTSETTQTENSRTRVGGCCRWIKSDLFN